MSGSDFPDIPGYTILSRLGKGGMATVYLAKEHKLHREVALKVMAEHLLSDPSFGKRFFQEATTVAQLTHRHIIPVYDYNSHDNIHYISMEYLPGGNLKGLLEKGLPLVDGLQVIEDVADALHYAAQKNDDFVHRDIKPENILFRADGSAVICDFGIAKGDSSGGQMTVVGTVIGTPHYMSPEQAKGEDLDIRSDLYSLGVILFELLTGHVPFEGGSPVETGILHVTAPVPRLPKDLAQFQPAVDKALAKVPDDRYQSGHEMLFALQDIVDFDYDRIQNASPTVMLSEEDILKGVANANKSSASQSVRPRSTGTGPSTRRMKSSGGGSSVRRPSRSRRSTSGRTRLTGSSASGGRGKTIAAAAAVVLTLAGSAWYFLGPTATDKPPVRPVVNIPGMDGKIVELREQATVAMQEQRLHEPEGDNAQYYLTSLLVLSPEDEMGKRAIASLFEHYIDSADQALVQRKFDETTGIINQLARIRFYIEDNELLKREAELRRDLIDLRKQRYIAEERQQRIEVLLGEASSHLEQGQLMGADGENAYDKYQEVLELEPENDAAAQGIAAIAGAYLREAQENLEQGNVGRARSRMVAAATVFPRHPDLATLREALEAEETRIQLEHDQALKNQADVLAADQRQRGEQKRRRQQQLESTLAEARQSAEAGALEAAIDKYNEALQLDPANINALDGQELVALKYVERAQVAISEDRLQEAEQSLGSARKLSPTNSQYRQVQTELIAARDEARRQELVEEERSERIASLLTRSELLFERGKYYLPEGNNVIESLQEVLQLDARNPSALALRERTNDKIYAIGLDFVSDRNFEDAQIARDALARNQGDPQQVAALLGELDKGKNRIAAQRQADSKAREQARQEEKRKRELAKARPEPTKTSPGRPKSPVPKPAVSKVDSLMADASGLGGATAIAGDNYRELAGIYSEVLKLQPANKAAKTGLQSVRDFSAGQVALAVQGEDFTLAGGELDYLESIGERDARLEPMRADLASAQRQHEQLKTYLGDADALIATPYKKPGLFGNNDVALRTLSQAYAKIALARGIAQSSPSVAEAERKLVAKYAEIITALVADEDLGDAQDFMAGLDKTKISSPAVDALQVQVTQLAEASEQEKTRGFTGF